MSTIENMCIKKSKTVVSELLKLRGERPILVPDPYLRPQQYDSLSRSAVATKQPRARSNVFIYDHMPCTLDKKGKNKREKLKQDKFKREI